MDNLKDLKVLVNSHYPIICIETFEERRAEDLVRDVASLLLLPLFVWTATEGLKREGEPKAAYQTKSPVDALNFINSASLDGIYLLKDMHVYFEDPLTVRRLRDISQDFRKRKRSLILTAPSFSLPLELEKEAVRFELSLPDRDELKALVRRVVHDIASKRKIKVHIDSPAGTSLVNNLAGLTLSEAERVLTRVIIDDGKLDAGDLPAILEAKQKKIAQSGILEYFPREGSFLDVGGLKNLKHWLKVRQGAFSEEAEEFGLSAPRGVLLLGVQGCGKSLMAKAIAQEWSLPLLRMDTGRLYDKYIGETEKNLREAIHLSESLAPVILWIDEIEKAFAGSNSSEADGGVSTRILGTFLSWLQEKKSAVFVVATSNDISKLPPELLRKGRLDEIFFVDLPGVEERKEIFSLHLKRRNRDLADFDLDILVQASEGFSGAEIEQAIVSALYVVFSGKDDLNTKVILTELKNTYPLSVVMKEQIEKLREWARGRTVCAN